VTSLTDHIISHDRTRLPSRSARRPMREDAGDVSVVRSPSPDAASVALCVGEAR
jgi:hypothetical protein